MTPDKLREKVGRAIYEVEFSDTSIWKTFDELDDEALADLDKKADAAIRIVVEACAEKAEGFNQWTYVYIPKDGGEWQPGSPYDRGAENAAKIIAAAIRGIVK